MTYDRASIDIRYEPDDVAVILRGDRPMLQWGNHPRYGNGWTLYYPYDPSTPTASVDRQFIPGDLLNLDHAVASALAWLNLWDACH